MPKVKVSLTITKKILDDVEALVDGIKIKNRSDAFEHLIRRSLSSSRTAVILLGGAEKRNYIKEIPAYRPLVKIGNKHLIEHQIDLLKISGFTRILIIAENNILADIFRVIGNGKKYGVKIEYITDKNSKGTLDSLKKAKDQLSSAFLIIYGDIIFTTDIKKLWDYHIKNSAAMTITLTSSQNPKEKGAALIEGEKITAFSQKSSIIKSNIVLSPIFACNPEMLEFSGHSIEKDLIPQLICAEKLFGYLTAGTEIHIHEAKNIKAAINLIEKHTNY